MGWGDAVPTALPRAIACCRVAAGRHRSPKGAQGDSPCFRVVSCFDAVPQPAMGFVFIAICRVAMRSRSADGAQGVCSVALSSPRGYPSSPEGAQGDSPRQAQRRPGIPSPPPMSPEGAAGCVCSRPSPTRHPLIAPVAGELQPPARGGRAFTVIGGLPRRGEPRVGEGGWPLPVAG